MHSCEAVGSTSEHWQVRAADLLGQLQSITGTRYVLTKPDRTRFYRKGYRFGEGNVLAVVRPGTLVEYWRVLKASIDAGMIVIIQAANTGLTGGSTPDGNDYDRGIVLINTMRMKRLQVISGGQQVVCFPGATLDQLERALKPFGREPHSVIGSSCLGASVFGGICNNSGGALVHRGPAFTQLALYARVDEDGRLDLVNHLGLRLEGAPEDALGSLDRWDIGDADIETTGERWASDRGYAAHVRDIDADTPSRFNADPRRLFEASGCAGRLALFAVRLDTFAKNERSKVFYIGTNRTEELTELRRRLLRELSVLPVAGEYLHRTAFNVAERYGKDTFLLIRHLGTARLPFFFEMKTRFDAIVDNWRFFPKYLSDRLLQALSSLIPTPVPERMRAYRDQFEHHLLLKVADDGIEETRALLSEFFASASGSYFECTDDEGEKAFLHRFAAASAAVRYRAVHHREVSDICALDIALRRNDRDWFETLPQDLEKQAIHKLYYGHFLCYVFHQDYIVKHGNDPLEFEHRMWSLLDERGAEYPAEHNVGHLYKAKVALRQFYQTLDPRNVLNPGIGQTSKCLCWRETLRR